MSRDKKGRFLPGQSGNPAGPGRGYGRIGALREQILEHVPDIIETLIQQARGGDVAAAKILLDKVLPSLKPEGREVVIDLTPDESLTEAARTVLASAARGDTPPEAAMQLLGGLGTVARIIETDELTRRIDALEKK